MTKQKTNSETPVERSKRGRPRAPSWQGDLSPFQRASPKAAVIDAVLELIRSGELAPGMRLPSETELAQTIGISRWSVREAVRNLEAMGILEIRHGSGTFVRTIDAGGGFDAQLLLMLDDQNVLNNLVEVRCAIDPIIGGLAAERATEDDIRTLIGAHGEMQNAPDRDRWMDAHLVFHEALVYATHNIILTKIWSLLVLFLQYSPLVTEAFSTPPYPPQHIHEELLKAVVAHDVNAAMASVEIHNFHMRRELNAQQMG